MKLYRLDFNRIHLGRRSLGDAMHYIHADTLFSALCIEALDMGGEELIDELKCLTEKGEIHFTDAMPYIGDTYYVPKPILSIKGKENLMGGSTARKVFKNLEYFPIEHLKAYVKGELTTKEAKIINDGFELGSSSVMTRVGLTEISLEDGKPEPYQVGVFSFEENAGLYILANENDLFKKLLKRLEKSGLGGKRSSGLGQFKLKEIDDIPEAFKGLLAESNANKYISLSCCLPHEDELEEVLKDLEKTSYKLIKRSGFVYSDTYAKQLVRKKDLYVFAAGSMFGSRFEGDIYDVRYEGTHPIYKYAKPFFLGVRE